MRLIDADELKYQLLKPNTNPTLWCVSKDAVDLIPTADAVPVVRCKDCRFLIHFTDGHLECRLLYDLRPVPCTYVTMQENDFCSYGKRREVTE